jgi:CelD/BcsL family acetyltransferase involved in cellulose biosynthesis
VHYDLEAAVDSWRLGADWRSTPFQRLDWLTLVVDKLVAPHREQILIVELRRATDQRPIMLLPLIRYQKRGFRCIEMLSCGVCDYAAPLFSTNMRWTAEEAAAVWQAVRRVLPPADIIQIDGLPRFVQDVANPLTMLTHIGHSDHTTCGLEIDGDPATVLARCCSPSFVRRLGKTGRRLEKRGAVCFIEATTPAQVDEIWAVLREQRAARFAKLGRFDLLGQPNLSDFYRSAALQGLTGGPVRLLGLRVGDQWAGTYYGLLHGRAFQGLVVTMAGDSWRTCSPGLHVHAHVIRWARAQGLSYFDMSVGPRAYKDDIGGVRMPLLSIEEALSLRGHAVLAGFRGFRALRAALRAHPRLFDQLRKIRHKFRRQGRR